MRNLLSFVAIFFGIMLLIPVFSKIFPPKQRRPKIFWIVMPGCFLATVFVLPLMGLMTAVCFVKGPEVGPLTFLSSFFFLIPIFGVVFLWILVLKGPGYVASHPRLRSFIRINSACCVIIGLFFLTQLLLMFQGSTDLLWLFFYLMIMMTIIIPGNILVLIFLSIFPIVAGIANLYSLSRYSHTGPRP